VPDQEKHPPRSEDPVLAETQTQRELRALQEERDSFYDQLLRKQAEFENYKKTVEREKAEFVRQAYHDLISEVVSVLDSFELALRNALSERDDNEDLINGFELIYKQTQDKLEGFGLKAIEAMGQKFDPRFHQAVATLATADLEENTVVEEMRKGYLLDGRLLRPAMVSVSISRAG
jgi:molecular chaperone GrpE